MCRSPPATSPPLLTLDQELLNRLVQDVVLVAKASKWFHRSFGHSVMQAAVAMDPWAVQPMERNRHAEQFASLGPINGFISGAQAKGFFMQSGLTPVYLAQIW